MGSYYADVEIELSEDDARESLLDAGLRELYL